MKNLLNAKSIELKSDLLQKSTQSLVHKQYRKTLFRRLTPRPIQVYPLYASRMPVVTVVGSCLHQEFITMTRSTELETKNKTKNFRPSRNQD